MALRSSPRNTNKILWETMIYSVGAEAVAAAMGSDGPKAPLVKALTAREA